MRIANNTADFTCVCSTNHIANIIALCYHGREIYITCFLAVIEAYNAANLFLACDMSCIIAACNRSVIIAGNATYAIISAGDQ